MLDVENIRKQFPILSRKVYGHDLIYLDNAASAQVPRSVIDAITHTYTGHHANVHRGVHCLSQEATAEQELTRREVAAWIGAPDAAEVLFTRGTTEGINLVASCITRDMRPGDEIVLTVMEHHSNIVPWQLLQARQGIRIRVVPMNDEGYLSLDALERLFNERTRLLCVAHVSNVLGTVNPVEQIIRMAHAHEVPVLVDGAQSTPHMPIDVTQMDCDFFAFSGHKLYAPTGIGVLYGKEKWLDRMPPYMGGGEMIKNVSFEHTTFNDLPYKFEAGTPDYVASTGLARAIDYMNALGMENIEAHERELTRYAMEQMSQIEGMHIYGPARVEHHDAVLSFQVGHIHHLDMGTLLDRLGIAVRTGHHCAEPLMHRLGIEGTCRASFALYNTHAEVDALVQGIERVRGMLE